MSFLLFLPYLICYSIFSHSKTNSSDFCDFCDICYFFYNTFLIAVFFKSFLLKLRKQFDEKFLLLLRFLRNLRTYWSPSWPFVFPSVEFCEICCSSYFCHICCSIFSHRKKNSCYFCGFLRNLRTSCSPSWPFLFLSVEFCEICYSCYFCHICCSIFSHSRKNSCYFCDFFKICGLLEALLDFFSF